MKLLTAKILKALFEAKIGSINESYATVRDRFVKDGANKAEVKSLLDLHKKLKDMRRLKDNEINIDLLAKGKSFDEFKTLMSRYSEKDTATKTDKFNELKNKIVAENDEWVVYEINTIDEAYLFHGLAKWCIISGTESDAEQYFDYYVFRKDSNFYFIVRKNPIRNKWDYIALQLQKNKKTYWDKNDKAYKSLPEELNVPELNVKYKNPPAVRSIPKSWTLNSDGTYDVNGSVDLENFKQFINSDGKLTVKFNKVTESFYCMSLNLTSLEGCPKEVGGSFLCGNNKLTSLEYMPKIIGFSFQCDRNDLKTLKGCPEKIPGDFVCSGNKLTTLEDGPKEVGENYICSENKLVSLKGCAKKVGESFFCEDNKGKQFTKSDVENVCKVGDEINV